MATRTASTEDSAAVGSGGVLFVDDDPMVLAALRRITRKKEHWRLFFAKTPDQALQVLADQDVDVIVSDWEMPPHRSGFELLSEVRLAFPDCVRLLLTANEAPRSKRVDSVVHRMFAKPIPGTYLLDHIQAILEVRELFEASREREAVMALGALPSPPEIIGDLELVFSNDSVSADQVAEVVRKDPAMTAKLLQLVNSAFFAPRRKLADVTEAVVYLGTGTIRALAMSLAVFEKLAPAGAAFGIDVSVIQQHAFRRAEIAKRIAPPIVAAVAYGAALLADCGILALAHAAPEAIVDAWDAAVSEGVSLWQAQGERGLIPHAYAGAYLMTIWGLPNDLVGASLYVDQPKAIGEGRPFDAGDAVHAAEMLLRPDGPMFDRDWAWEFASSAQLSAWNTIVATVSAETGGSNAA